MWKFLVKNQRIEVLEREVLADNQIQFVQFKFTFDGDWKHFHKVVQFSQCDETYNIAIGTGGVSCYLPAELHAGAVKMSVFGYDAESDTTVRATTVPVTLNIRPSGFVGDEDTPIPPTPDLYVQLLKEIESVGKGADGKSAYEIAVAHGYVGTETEWLESLKAGTADFQQFMDSTKYEIQTLNEEVGNFSRTAHTHENQEVLDGITTEKIAQWNSNYALQYDLDSLAETVKAEFQKVNRSLHQHSNKGVLDTVTTDKVTGWDKAVVLSADVPTLKTQLDQLEQQLEAGLAAIVEV